MKTFGGPKAQTHGDEKRSQGTCPAARNSEFATASYLGGMTPRFFDWLGRVIMLVLAGMITLSIIGSIAAIPSGSIETRMGIEQAQWPAPQPETQPRPVPPEPVQQQPAETAPQPAAPPAPAMVPARAPAPSPPPDPARWLEAITYALIALAGIAAFATILFWRALGHWRRSADALELLAHRNP